MCIYRPRAGALVEFQAVVALRETDAAAANNAALARLYLCDLRGAVVGMEAALKSRPHAHLQEAVIANLCAS